MKLIILDRDGVLNQDRDDFVKSEDEWIPLPGSMDAVALFKQAGYTVVIATNQQARDTGAKAGALVKAAAAALGGGGGGRPDLAQGGGQDASRVPEALAAVTQALSA